ncbi:TRAP transporter permease [Thermodesulfobacteriota bacterium]
MAKNINWLKVLSIAISAIAFIMGVYHLVYSRWLLQDPLMHQNTHLTFALLLVYLTALSKKPKQWPYISFFLLLSLIGVIYVQVNYIELAERAGIPTTVDIIIGTIIVLVVLEACRITFGWIIPSIGVLLMAYALLSAHLPPPFYHTPITYSKVISWSSIAFNGVYGMFLHQSATYMIFFILFGGLLQATGVSESFMELGKAVGTKFRSGPAQTAVVSSGLIGMVMGAGVANVAFTGPITIPVMKRAGYSPEQAGAVEAAASAGGQIMPPIMAVAAFLMAGLIGIPYASIIYAAAIPAIIYFLSIFWAVHLYALKQGLSTVTEVKVDKGIIKRRFPVFLVPIALIVVLLSKNYSATLAAFWAIVTLLVLSCIQKETRLNWSRLIEGFRKGCVAASGLAVAIATIGVVTSMIKMTGVGIEVAYTVEMWSLGIPFIAVFICMCVTIILGCGMPIPAAYALVAIVVAPVLVRLGLPVLQVHLFIFYFAAFSTLSPPVASAPLMASSISGGSYFKTAIESMRVASPAFIIPWLFLWNPNMIAHFTGFFSGLGTVIAAVVLIFSLQSWLFGHMLQPLNLKERGVFFIIVAALVTFTITMHFVFFIIGLVLFLPMVFVQARKFKLEKAFQPA